MAERYGGLIMKDFLKKIVGLSPAIGKALGGPLGGLLGTGVKAAAALITGKGEPADILESLMANPEKLRELEITVKELELDELRLHAEDRGGARDMTTELAKAGHGAAWASAVVSIVVTVGFFIVLYVVLSGGVPEGGKEVVLILLGTLAAGFTQVLNFWLGSSKGSKDKTLHLAGRGK